MLGNVAKGVLSRGKWLAAGVGAGALAGTAYSNPYGFGSGMEGAFSRGGMGAAIGGLGVGLITRRFGGLKFGAAAGATAGAFYGARNYNAYRFGQPVQQANIGYRTEFPYAGGYY